MLERGSMTNKEKRVLLQQELQKMQKERISLVNKIERIDITIYVLTETFKHYSSNKEE